MMGGWGSYSVMGSLFELEFLIIGLLVIAVLVKQLRK